MVLGVFAWRLIRRVDSEALFGSGDGDCRTWSGKEVALFGEAITEEIHIICERCNHILFYNLAYKSDGYINIL